MTNNRNRKLVLSVHNFVVYEEVQRIRGKDHRLHFVGRPPIVLIIPFNRVGRLSLIRSVRTGFEKPLLEFPAGRCEPGERPVDAAARELLEETGIVADSMTSVGTILTAPHFSDEVAHVFSCLGSVTQKKRLTEVEDIEHIEISQADMKKLVASGALLDSKSLAAWLLLLAQGRVKWGSET